MSTGCAGEYFGGTLQTAVQNGQVPESVVDEKATRLLRQLDRTGHLDGDKQGDPGAINTSEHQQLSREIAEEESVLLKNDGTLPLATDEIDSLAVVGPSADEALVGGRGSSAVTPPTSVDPLTGIENFVGDSMDVTHTIGTKAGLPPIPAERFETPDEQTGLAVTYYDGINWGADPVALETTESNVDLTDTYVGSDDALGADSFSARMTGSVLVRSRRQTVRDSSRDRPRGAPLVPSHAVQESCAVVMPVTGNREDASIDRLPAFLSDRSTAFSSRGVGDTGARILSNSTRNAIAWH